MIISLNETKVVRVIFHELFLTAKFDFPPQNSQSKPWNCRYVKKQTNLTIGLSVLSQTPATIFQKKSLRAIVHISQIRINQSTKDW